MFGKKAGQVLHVALAAVAVIATGCVGGGSGGAGGGVIVFNCTTDAECNGGKCVSGSCQAAGADAIGGDGVGSSGAASSGGTSGGTSGGATDGGGTSGGTSSGASDGGGTSGGTSGGSSGGGAKCDKNEDCDDERACTVDKCTDGQCTNKPDDGTCFIDGNCYDTGKHPTDPCKSCSDENNTSWTSNSGAACDDGDKCTKDDKCDESGKCKGNSQGACCEKDADCVSTSACKIGACNLDTKQCQYFPKPGCCASDEDCSKAGAKPCTKVFCNKEFSTCDVKNQPDGAICDDGDGCTAEDTCTSGYCVGSAKKCDDSNTCTTDSCQSGKCVFTPIPGCGGQQCSSGTCCDTFSGKYKAKGTSCSSSAVKSEYRCSGSYVQRRIQTRGCSGYSSSCSTSSSNYVWSAWQNYQTCNAASGYTCQQSGTSASCQKGGTGTQCTSGSCCDTFTKTYRPQGYKCGTTKKATQYKCDGVKYLRRRYAYQGCSGTSSSCSSSSANYHYTSWSSYQTCASSSSSTKACYQSSSTSAYCTSEKYCSSGTCCYTSYKAIQPKYTKCSSSVQKTEYKCAGNKVLYRRAYRGCSGSSTTCQSSSSYWHWTDWLTYKQCSSGQLCKSSGSSSSPGTCGGGTTKQCSSGTCCNTSTGMYKPAGTTCSSSIASTQYKCSGVKYVYRRYAYRGCSGSSTSCSSSSTNWVYSSWSKYKTCATSSSSSQACYQSSSSNATCSSKKYCSSGTCCDTYYKSIRPRYTKCGSSTKQYQYKCQGNKIVYRRAYYGCSGSSTSCSSSSSYYHWTDYTTYKTCGSGQVCKPGSSSASAGTCVSSGGGGTPKQCSSGTCCNTQTGRYRTKGEKCGSSAVKYEYQCSSTGKSIYRRYVYQGCSGYSSACSSSSSNYYYGSWGSYSSCGSGQHCYISSSSKKGYCTSSSSTGKCSSGTCCNTSYKIYRPQFYKCSSSAQSTQYKCSTDGKTVYRRYAYKGCTGYSLTCSTSSTNWNWGSWGTYKTCSSGTHCKQTSSSSASCYASGT